MIVYNNPRNFKFQISNFKLETIIGLFWRCMLDNGHNSVTIPLALQVICDGDWRQLSAGIFG